MNKKKLLFLSITFLNFNFSNCFAPLGMFASSPYIAKFKSARRNLHLLPNGNVITYGEQGAFIVGPKTKPHPVSDYKGMLGTGVYPSKMIYAGNDRYMKWDDARKIGNLDCAGIKLEAVDGYEITEIYNMPNGNFATIETEWEESFKYQRNVVRIWDSETGAWLKTLSGHADYIDSLVFLKNGNIATSSMDNTVKIWNPETEECILTITSPKANAMHNALELPDGTIATCSKCKSTIRIWNPETGRLIRIINLGGRVSYEELLPDGNLLYCIDSVTTNKQIKIVNPTTGKCVKEFKINFPDKTELENVEMLSNGNIAYWYDSSVFILDYVTGKVVQELVGHAKKVITVTPLANGNILTNSWEDNATRMWNESGECIQIFEGGLCSPYIQTFAQPADIYSSNATLLPTGELVTLSNNYKTIRIYNLESGECVDTINSDKENEFQNVIIRQDGTLATTENKESYYSTGSELKFWKISTKTK